MSDKCQDIRARVPRQECVVCGAYMSAMPGTRDAVCPNCGYKDPCCE